MTEPVRKGIKTASLTSLLKRARESQSDALVLLKDGKLVGAWNFGNKTGPIEAMSATKSVVSLAIGALIDDGRIKSLDQPVHEWYPEWKQGAKRRITLRHLLSHTSGLKADAVTAEIYNSRDFVKLALTAPLMSPPGSRFFYNNKAVNLISGIVQRAAGERMDWYIRERLFKPLSITGFSWTLDRAGNPHAMAGLQIRAVDLAKIGQLVLDRGVWQGRRVVSARWIQESTGMPGQKLDPSCGLLWWLVRDEERLIIDDRTIDAWRRGGVDVAFINKIKPLKDRPFAMTGADGLAQLRTEVAKTLGGGEPGLKTWDANTWQRGLPQAHFAPGPVTGCLAEGFLGQYLVALPRERLVAVRQIRAAERHYDGSKADYFEDFLERVRALTH